MKPERVVRYHDGNGWQLAVASEPGPKYVHLCLSDATSVFMAKVAAGEARTHLQAVDYPLPTLIKKLLRPRTSLGIKRSVSTGARRFLTSQ